MEYYQDLITKKSFQILKEISQRYQFILIGGWAVFFYAKALKSKDIDLIIDYQQLEKMRLEFDLAKNERLKKYEISIEGIDIDIYLPFYSDLGLPIEIIKENTRKIENFSAPRPEILLILKQKAYLERQGSAKGEKDKIDIIALLNRGELDFRFYKNTLSKCNLQDYQKKLEQLLGGIKEMPELNLNHFQYARLKKKILAQLK